MNRQHIIESMSKSIRLKITETFDPISTLDLAEAALDAFLDGLCDPYEKQVIPVRQILNGELEVPDELLNRGAQLYQQILGMRKKQ